MSGHHNKETRATLAGAPILYFACLQGAAVIAWGRLPYLALTGLAFLGLPLRLPCALFRTGERRCAQVPGTRLETK